MVAVITNQIHTSCRLTELCFVQPLVMHLEASFWLLLFFTCCGAEPSLTSSQLDVPVPTYLTLQCCEVALVPAATPSKVAC